jgi:xanthine/uracil permease
MPQWLRYIFGGSGIVPAAVLAIILNITVPKE